MMIPVGLHRLRSAIAGSFGREGSTRAERAAMRAAAPRLDAEDDCRPEFGTIVRIADSPYPILQSLRSGFYRHDDAVTGEGVRYLNGHVFKESRHYSDDRTLVLIPRHFDRTKPFRIVLFLHGQAAILCRTVARDLEIGHQVESSGANAILVAPALTRNAVDNNDYGNWMLDTAVFRRFVTALSKTLADDFGFPAAILAPARYVLAGFSGAYRAMSRILFEGLLDGRLDGVVMVDSLFGNSPDFAKWIGGHRQTVLSLSILAQHTRNNHKAFVAELKKSGVEAPDTSFDMSAGGKTVAAILSSTEHWRAPIDGPPAFPVAAMLTRLRAEDAARGGIV